MPAQQTVINAASAGDARSLSDLLEQLSARSPAGLSCEPLRRHGRAEALCALIDVMYGALSAAQAITPPADDEVQIEAAVNARCAAVHQGFADRAGAGGTDDAAAILEEFLLSFDARESNYGGTGSLNKTRTPVKGWRGCLMLLGDAFINEHPKLLNLLNIFCKNRILVQKETGHAA